MKPLGKRSFLKILLHALRMNKDSVSFVVSLTETMPSGSARMHYVHPGFVRTAWLKAEQAKAMAIMEMERRKAFCMHVF
jgi:hypothetical protein